jgi:metal-sulfur cluster biosynthetic enzyme
MRAPLTAGLALVLALASGCGDPARGNLEVRWTFDGKTCAAAGVHTIQVDIAHEVLTPNQFSCNLGGGTIAGGANLGTYLVGRYTLTISGLDVDGALLYQTQQDVSIQRGDNVLDVDVQKVPGGSISVNWTFAGLTCAQAGVTSVRISVDGALILDQGGSIDLACSANGVDGTSISPLGPGLHHVYLVGVKGGVPSYWLQDVQVTVSNGADTSVQANLPLSRPSFAIADVSWDALASGGGFALGTLGAMTCAEAQVDVVRITLDPNPDGSGGTPAGDVACDTGGVEGAQVPIAATGTHSFAITGFRGSAVVYQTTHPASARFELGLVSNVDVDADPTGSAIGTATLNWDFTPAAPACPVSYTLTSPSGSTQTGSTPCGTSRVSLTGYASGLWGIDATAGAFQSQILFAVPNQSSASWQIPFSR